MVTSSVERHPAARAVAWLLFGAAALLFLGGFMRGQANMISSGLLFVVFGLLATLNLRRTSPLMKGIIVVLAAAAGIWAFVTL